MGQVGIISCGVIINEDFDVDVDGDLLIVCFSDYLIVVINIDYNDFKVQLVGYGVIIIDLVVLGVGVFNIINGGNYVGFGGILGVILYVVGIIVLLYSMDCFIFVVFIELDLLVVGLMVWQVILESVDLLVNLQDIIVIGGCLNVNNVVQYMLGFCDGCILVIFV